MTHYQRLGVARDAPAAVIRAAYKALAQAHHPDKNLDNPDATEAMQEINQAYAVLSDPQRRADYDMSLARAEEAERAVWTQPPPAPQQQGNAARPASRAPMVIFVTALVGAMIFSFSYAYIFKVSPRAASGTAPETAPAPPQPVLRKIEQTASDPRAAERRLADCVFSAASAYDVRPSVLLALFSAAGGASGDETPAADGGSGLGAMQVNTWWVPQLAALWHVPPEKAEDMVRDDVCVNIGVAAWIFHAAAEEGGTLQRQVARYDASVRHLPRADENAAYVAKVLRLARVYKNVRRPRDLLGGEKPVAAGKP